MEELKEKKEYNEMLFFHGMCFDKKYDQAVYRDLGYSPSDVSEYGKIYQWGKRSRYCLVGKYNYQLKQLELGLSMLEHPYPYVKKTAREVAVKNMNEKNYFSLQIPFVLLEDIFYYDLGSEIYVFNNVKSILNRFSRGSLIYLFRDKILNKFVNEVNKMQFNDIHKFNDMH